VNFLGREENNFWHSLNEPIPEELPTVEANEFLPHIGKWINIGGGFLLSIFVAGISLTSILKYKVTVKAPATIRPIGELRVVESAITGTVDKIGVKDNQVVSKGEVIAYVDDSRLQTQKSQLQNSIQQSQLQLSQIDAQLGEVDAQIAAQTNLINRTIIAAQAELGGTQRNHENDQINAFAEMTQAETALNLAKVQQDRLQREKLLTVTVQEAETALNLARVQRDRLQREKLLTATVQEAEAALTLARVQRDRLQPIVALGAISRNLYEEKQQAVISAKARLEQAKANAKNLLEEKYQAVISAEAKLEQAKANAKNLLDEKDQALTIAQTNLQKAQTAINPSNATVTVASERIKQEQARGEATLAALKKERETLIQQRLEFQKQLASTGKDLQQVENDLNKSIVRAPIAGTVLQLRLRNPGQVVQPSEAIAQIAPLNAPVLIKAEVTAQNIDKVKAGQNVQMQVSACPYPDYGTLKGTVKTVAPDALPTVKNSVAPNTPPQTAMATYEVMIEPQTLHVGRGDRQCHLKSGMEGRADIISREETVLQFILRKAKLITEI
jgi:multidrug efflux pump subunit AcrA (membrane-fusion protein)